MLIYIVLYTNINFNSRIVRGNFNLNIVGIVAEYNPLHEGHKYHIKEAKLASKADMAVVVMSGSFTEQGNIGVLNKFNRASTAIKAGADMVIELPTIYAVSSAKDFAFGAVKLLNELNIITHIAFGAECENIQSLESIADKFLKYENDIDIKIQASSKKNTYAKEYLESASKFLSKEEYSVATLPNNILGIEYLKSLKLLNSKIKPVLIHRKGSDHSSDKTSLESKFASSTAIRNLLIKKDFDSIYNLVPKETYSLLKESRLRLNSDIFDVLKYKVISLGKEGLNNILDVSEGLNNRLYTAILNSKSYDEYIMKVKTKRYTLSRIKRICIYIILDITKETACNLKKACYIRVLKLNKSANILLSSISKKSKVPLITKVTDDIICKLKKENKDSLLLDIYSSNVANIYSNDKINDYTNKIK